MTLRIVQKTWESGNSLFYVESKHKTEWLDGWFGGPYNTLEAAKSACASFGKSKKSPDITIHDYP
jgi:hypothetical protein